MDKRKEDDLVLAFYLPSHSAWARGDLPMFVVKAKNNPPIFPGGMSHARA